MVKLSIFLTLAFMFSCSGWAQTSHPVETPAKIEVGWIAAMQEPQGWRVTKTLPILTVSKDHSPSEKTGNLREGDLLISVDGQELAVLGPLAVAAILDQLPFSSTQVELQRHGRTYTVRAFSGNTQNAAGDKSAPAVYSLGELQKRDDPAPPFSLSDLNGRTHTLASMRGRWILLNFWGTWCSGCMDEIPALNELETKYSSKLAVVSNAVNDTRDTLNKFLQRQTLSYPVLLGGDFDDQVAKAYNVKVAPTNVVISPDGQVRFVGIGWPESLKSAVETIAAASSSR